MALYTFATAKTEIQYRLGNRSDVSSGSPSRLDNWLNSACLILAKCDIELPLLETVATKSLSSGTAEYDLVSTLSLSNVLGIRTIRNQTSSQRLRWMNWEEYRSLATQASAAPVRWTRRGNLLAFDPNPNATTSIKIDYRKRPTAGALTEFDDEWHEVLISLATHLGWKALQEYQQAQATFSLLPAFIQRSLQQPLGQDEWEAMQGDRGSIEPMGDY